MAEFTDNARLTNEQILANFNRFEQLCSKLSEDKQQGIREMLDDLGTRLAVAPASSRKHFHAAWPGGLVDHSLRVAEYALKLRKSVPLFENLAVESVLFAALFHDIGKVGQPGKDGQDYYVVQTSDWHRKNLGEYYNTNPDIQWMENVDHSMHILIHYGIKTTEDEYLAVRLNDGPVVDANKKYAMREPKLALLIQVADRLASEEEKGFVD